MLNTVHCHPGAGETRGWRRWRRRRERRKRNNKGDEGGRVLGGKKRGGGTRPSSAFHRAIFRVLSATFHGGRGTWSHRPENSEQIDEGTGRTMGKCSQLLLATASPSLSLLVHAQPPRVPCASAQLLVYEKHRGNLRA